MRGVTAYIFSLVVVFAPGVLLPSPALAVDIYNLQGSFTPIPITGNPFFDFFFTLMTIGGLVSFSISVLVKILSRS